MPLNLIPEFFYDLIGRVIPGFVVIIMWYLTILGPNKAIDTITRVSSQSNQPIFNLWSFSILLAIAYLLGLILEEIWSVTFWRIKGNKRGSREAQQIDWCIAEYERVRKCLGQPELGLQRQDLPPIQIVQDHLRLHSQSEAYRLVKLRAETRLSDTLFTGLLLLPVINVLFWYRDSRFLMLDRIFLELALILAIVILWRAGDSFHRFYVGGTHMSWLLYSFPIHPPKQIEASPTHPSDAPAD